MAETAAPNSSIDFRKPGFAVSLLGAVLPGLYLLITSTTTLVTSIWPYDFKRMLEFGLLFVLFLLPMVSRPIREEFGALLAGVPRWVGWTLIFIFAWGVLSASVNARSWMHYANSLSEVFLLSSLVLGVLVVAACRRLSASTFDQFAIGLIALTGLVVGVQELTGVVAAHAGRVEFSFQVSTLHFSWPRFYNQVQTWSVPVIAVLPLVFARYPLFRPLCVLTLGLHWYVILVTGARGSFLALALAISYAALFLPPAREVLRRWQVPGILLGAAIYGIVLASFEMADYPGPFNSPQAGAEAGLNPLSDTAHNPHLVKESEGRFVEQSIGRPLIDNNGRFWMWGITLRDISQHPIFGIGPMNYSCTGKEYIGHPHNFPLQVAAEWGLAAAFAVLLIPLVALFSLTKQIRGNALVCPERAVLVALLTTSVLAAALHACLSGVMVMPASQVTGLLVAGMLLSLGLNSHASKRDGKSWLVPTAGIIACSSLLLLGAQELRTMEHRSAMIAPGEDLHPRIWQDSRVCRLYVQPNRVNY